MVSQYHNTSVAHRSRQDWNVVNGLQDIFSTKTLISNAFVTPFLRFPQWGIVENRPSHLVFLTHLET